MPATPTHGIVYPLGSVAPNMPLLLQQLAESVDSALVTLEPDYCLVAGTVGQSIPNAAWTKGTFSGTTVSTTGTVDTAGGTITITRAGFYVIYANGGTAATTTGAFGCRIDKGGVTLSTTLLAASAAGSSAGVTAMAYLAVGDAVSFSLYQSSTAARTTTATPAFGLVRVAG